jgi:hypothetical protein
LKSTKKHWTLQWLKGTKAMGTDTYPMTYHKTARIVYVVEITYVVLLFLLPYTLLGHVVGAIMAGLFAGANFALASVAPPTNAWWRSDYFIAAVWCFVAMMQTMALVGVAAKL